MEFSRNRYKKIEVAETEMEKFDTILKFVTESFSVDKDAILNNQKKGDNQNKAIARQQIVFLCLKYTTLPYPIISKLLGFRSGYVSNIVYRKSKLFEMAKNIEDLFVKITGFTPVDGYHSRLYPTDDLSDE